jgi:hypothetical protein
MLAPFDGYPGSGIEKAITSGVFQNKRICLEIFKQSFSNTMIDRNLMALAPLLFLDPKRFLIFPSSSMN